MNLAITARASAKSCALLWGISEEEKAVSQNFDVECNVILYNWELEREQERDKLLAEILASALGVKFVKG